MFRPMRRFVALLALLAPLTQSEARDTGQWGEQPPHIRQWFQSLMQPDTPWQSCCGEADAVEADIFESEDGDLPAGYDGVGMPIIQHGTHYIAVVTDGRGIVPDGTRIRIPDRKIKWDSGNPTGHGIVFLGTHGEVYCYVTPGGV
jgi:hypothetical protein